jgi:hypothetical protein
MSDERFSSSVFFHESVSRGPLSRYLFSIPLVLGPVPTKIPGDISNIKFITVVIDNDSRYGNNDTGDNKSPVTRHRRQLIAGIIDTGDETVATIMV